MSTSSNKAVLAALHARYTELRATLNAAHDAKPIDWATVAAIEEQLGELMNELSEAVWSRDTFFGCVALDAAGGFRRSAVESRRLVRPVGGER
jgi:GH15 family glucan-1,4-alpha-glucosidase